jgi:hypothetical protein
MLVLYRGTESHNVCVGLSVGPSVFFKLKLSNSSTPMGLPSKNCQIFSQADGGIGNFLTPPGGSWQIMNMGPYSDGGDLTFLGFR